MSSTEGLGRAEVWHEKLKIGWQEGIGQEGFKGIC